MKNFLNAIIFLVTVFSILYGLTKVYSSLEIRREVCVDVSTFDTFHEETYAVHKRSWRGYNYGQSYCMEYQLAEGAYDLSQQKRQELTTISDFKYNQYWGKIYRHLYESDEKLFEDVQDSLLRVGLEDKLSKSEFAMMLVAFVQDIPYKFIDTHDCSSQTFTGPCVPNIPYGILSPFEFLYTLNGDCDTRTVLLYTLLKNFGYHPLILISREYRHSMLALDIPAAGEYIEHKGRKFYFWETTSTGWEPGMIAPDMKNLSYWNIALDYEY